MPGATLTQASPRQQRLDEGPGRRSNVAAWTQWVKGLSLFRGPVTKENMAAALACWQRALAHEPGSAALNPMVGFIHYVDARFCWWDDRQTAQVKLQSYADRAMQLDPDHPDAEHHGELRPIAAASLRGSRCPCAPGGEAGPWRGRYGNHGLLRAGLCWIPQRGGGAWRTVNDHEPEPAPVSISAISATPTAWLAGRLGEAEDLLRGYQAKSPGFGLVDLVLIHRQLGKPEEAEPARPRLLLAIRRDFTVTAWANAQIRADAAGLAMDIAALQAAGLPPDGVTGAARRLVNRCRFSYETWLDPTAVRAEPMDQTDLSPSSDGGATISAQQLRNFVDRIERLEQDKAGIADDIKDCYAEAKSLGYEVKILRKVIALRKKKPNERREE